jgi:hypothetical protein
VTTTCLLDDFRKIKVEKIDNLVYLMSYVSSLTKELYYRLSE